MSIGVFSEINSGAKSNSGVTAPAKNVSAQGQKTDIDKPETQSKKEKILSAVKTAAPIVIPLAAIPVTALVTYKLSTKNINGLKREIESLTRDMGKLQVLAEERARVAANNLDKHVEKAGNANAQIWSALLAVAGLGGCYKAGQMSSRDKETVTDKISERISGIDRKSSDAANGAQEALAASGQSLNRKYVKSVNGINLLQNSTSLNKNAHKYEQAVQTIQSAAPKHLYEAPDIPPMDKQNPSLWSVTSEFAPIKEGGLGSVPVEIQNNAVKLGIQMPAFIPMYQQKGLAGFKQKDGTYTYSYKGKEFDLKKVASFKLDAYQGGKSKVENVEIFVSDSFDANGNKKQLVFVKNDNYFNGTIYQASEKTEEPEKFAFFSKAVYEFAKAKEDMSSVKDLVITDKDAFDSIPAPDGFILNDWQASPIAALARYKAPMENAYGQLSDDAAKKLSEMRIITIGHNAMYQGSTLNNNNNEQRKEATSNILNTLFDNFAYDIVSNAETGASKKDPDDAGLKNLDNVLILNQQDGNQNHTNLLNMGICLSDYFHPVSQNYAKEIISDEHPELAGELRWALNQRDKSKSLVGIINGNDFNNLSIEAKKANIKQNTGIDFETYTKQSDISDVMAARRSNKINFYNSYIVPFSLKNTDDKSEAVEKIRKISSKLEFVDAKKSQVVPKLTDEQLANTPVISSAGRLVSQKGIPVMSDAIKMLLENWEQDFPGKPKPIFYLAGEDGENGVHRAYIEKLKNERLSKEDSDRIIFGHGFAPMSAIMAASDFFLLPSMFEPCGLTQGESFAVATPVIGSAVGGIVDTVNRNGKENAVLTKKEKQLTAGEFYEALKKGLNIYFNEPEKYQKMVEDSLAEDFSWIQPGKQGPVYDYLDRLGISRDSLPDAV